MSKGPWKYPYARRDAPPRPRYTFGSVVALREGQAAVQTDAAQTLVATVPRSFFALKVGLRVALFKYPAEWVVVGWLHTRP